MELYRVVRTTVKVGLIVIIALVALCVYRFQNEDIVHTSNYEYAINYDIKLKADLINAQKKLGYSLFQNENSYFYRNTNKYINDINKVINIDVRPANTTAIEELIEYDFVTMAMAAFMIIIVMTLLQEEINGVKKIVRASANGRIGLVLKRVAIIALLSAITSLVINFIIFVILLVRFGGFMDIIVPIQSVPQLALFPLRISILEFFYLYCGVCAITEFAVGLLVYSIMQLIGTNKLGLSIILAIAVIEYVLYLYVPASSRFNFLKYVNLIFLFLPGKSVMYENWGNDVYVTDVYNSATILALIIIVIGLVTNIILYVYKYEHKESKLYSMLQRRLQIILTRMNSFGLELYKVLILQLGIIIILAFFMLLDNAKISRGIDTTQMNYYVEKFYESYEWQKPTSSSDTFIKQLEVKYEEMQTQSVMKEQMNILSRALMQLKCQSEYLRKMESEGVSAVFINNEVYDELFGNRLYNNQANINLLCIISIVFSVGGIFAYERKYNMMMVCNSYSNRNIIYRNKMFVTIFISIVIWIISVVKNWININEIYQLNYLDAPLKSLPQFEKFVFEPSIAGYLIFIQFYRLFCIVAVAIIVYFISIKLEYSQSIIAATIVLLPHLLSMLGIDIFSTVSIVNIMDFNKMFNMLVT